MQRLPTTAMLTTGRPGTPAFGGVPVDTQQHLHLASPQPVDALQGSDAENEAPAGVHQHTELKEAMTGITTNLNRRVLRPLQPDTSDCGSATVGGVVAHANRSSSSSCSSSCSTGHGGSSQSMLRVASDGDFRVIAPHGERPCLGADEAAKLGGASPKISTACSRRPRHECTPPQDCRGLTASASSTPPRASRVGPGLVLGCRGGTRTTLIGSHNNCSFGNEFPCSTSASSFATRDFAEEHEPAEANCDATFCAGASSAGETCVKAELMELRTLRSDLMRLRQAHQDLCDEVQNKLVNAKHDARLTCSKATPASPHASATERSKLGQQRSTEKEIAEIRELISELRANQRESQHEKEEVLLGLQQNILREVRVMLDSDCSRLAGVSSQEAFAAAAVRVAATCGVEQQRVLQAVQNLPPPTELGAAKPPDPAPVQFSTPKCGCASSARASTPAMRNRGLLGGTPQQLQRATGHSPSTSSSLAAPTSGGAKGGMPQQLLRATCHGPNSGRSLAAPTSGGVNGFFMSPRLTHTAVSPSVPSPSASFCPLGRSRVAQQTRLASSTGILHTVPSSRSSGSPQGVFRVGSPQIDRHHRAPQHPALSGLGRVPPACWHSPRQ